MTCSKHLHSHLANVLCVCPMDFLGEKNMKYPLPINYMGIFVSRSFLVPKTTTESPV